MYTRLYKAYKNLPNGDLATLKRCNLKTLQDSPSYFRILKRTGLPDNKQTVRVLFLMVGVSIGEDSCDAHSVAIALLKAGVKESQIIQITRSGDNGISYLKRQLIRCNSVSLDSLGRIGQFWGDNARRSLLKEFILADQD